MAEVDGLRIERERFASLIVTLETGRIHARDAGVTHARVSALKQKLAELDLEIERARRIPH